MAEEKKNGRLTLTSFAMLVAIVGGPLAVWGDAQRKDGQREEQILTLQKQRDQDRSDTRTSINEVKEHVKLIDQNTQIILQEIRAMQAVQRAERRERSR